MDEGQIARLPRAGAGGRKTRLRRAAATAAWSTAIVGFVVYLVRIDAFVEAFGGIGTGIVLLMWLTLFSSLHSMTARLRIRAPAPAPRSRLADRVDLVVEPSAALRNTSAQGGMMSALGTRAAGLSDRELELMDWGFAFGVAWAVAREQDPGASEELVGMRALNVTQAVFEAYSGRPAPALNGNGRLAAHAHANGGGAAHSRHLGAQHERAHPPRQSHPAQN
jgi:hypothetical protein